ncbi:arginine ABC transporter ATP-binding protein ArtP, partial [Vibrio alginolyticus]
VLYLEQGHIVEHGTHDAFVNPQTTQFADYLNH